MEPDDLDRYDLLDITDEFRPPTHYQLLGIDDFETDLDVIAEAVKARGVYLHQIAAGPERKAVQQLLGEVAVARRTLLNAESKQVYDDQLLADTEDYEEHAGGFQIDTGHESSATESDKADAGGKAHAAQTPTRPRRRKKSTWDEYKLHAASASILLLIVGIVWIVNRNAGERRAAKAGAVRSSPAVASRITAPQKTSAPARRRTPSRAAQRQLGAASPRSGQGSLAPDFGTEQYLQKDAPSMSKPKEAGSVETQQMPATQPHANQGYAVALNLPADWQPDIDVKDDFTGKLTDRYQLQPRKSPPVKIEQQRLTLLPATGSGFVVLKHKSIKLKAGQSVAIDANLPPGLTEQVQVGVVVGSIRIGLGAKNDQIQIRVKHISKKNEQPATLLGQMKAAETPTTLIVMRSVQNPKRLDWLAHNASADQSGRIQVSSLPAQAPVAIFVAAPEQATDKPVWVDNLRAGDFANAPQWQQTDPLRL